MECIYKRSKRKKSNLEEFEKVSKKFREFASGNLHLQNYFLSRYKDYALKLEADKNLIADIKKNVREEFIVIISTANFAE